MSLLKWGFDAYLATASYGELSKSANVVDKDIHEAQFVTESNKDVETGGM